MLDVNALTSNVGEFQREYNFRFDILTYPIALLPSLLINSQNVDAFDFHLDTFSVAGSKVKDEQVKSFGHFAWYTGAEDSEGKFTATFNLGTNTFVLRLFESWRNIRLNNLYGGGLTKVLCTGTVQITVFGLDKKTEVCKYTFYNVQCSGVDAIDYKKSGDAIPKVKVQFVYERRTVQETPGAGYLDLITL